MNQVHRCLSGRVKLTCSNLPDEWRASAPSCQVLELSLLPVTPLRCCLTTACCSVHQVIGSLCGLQIALICCSAQDQSVPPDLSLT